MARQKMSEDELLRSAASGDTYAMTRLFSTYRQRLKRMVRLRMSPRLAGRIDDSDVLQEALLEVARHLEEYLKSPQVPLYLWMRQVTERKLIDVHRRHLGAQRRSAGREISLNQPGAPVANAATLAEQLAGDLTAPSKAAVRQEQRQQIQQALNAMRPMDREILALRHFEQLSNSETAQVLRISSSAASSRYVRALERLKKVLETPPRQ